MGDQPWKIHTDGLRLRLRVTPRARRNAINGILETPGDKEGPSLKVSVTAPPADGKANAAVLALLAKALHVPKSTLSVITGTTGRNKLIHIPGDGPTLIPMLEALAEEKAIEKAGPTGRGRVKK